MAERFLAGGQMPSGQGMNIPHPGIWVEADEVSLATLADALAATGRDTPLLVRADRNLPLQQFVDVYEAVRGLGFTTLSLQTEQRP